MDAVKALLDPANAKLPDVNAPAGPEEYGASPLYVACDAGRCAIVSPTNPPIVLPF